MPRRLISSARCQICGLEKPTSGMVPIEIVRPEIGKVIRENASDLDPAGYICLTDLGRFRREYLSKLLQEELGELSTLDKEVLESMHQRDLLSSNVTEEFDRQSTFGERLADRIADFGGSWTFLICFAVVLIGWISLNAVMLSKRAFDPYPFILLNLILSCLAAIQAPVIMMSQNRAEARDRLRAENDYKVNLKAELEIRHLHEKMDHLLRRQWQRLFEIQQIQIELLESLTERKKV